MLVITTAVALSHALRSCAETGPLERYSQYFTDSELAVLFVLGPGDRAQDLETLRRQPFEDWEFIALERGWYEAVFIVSDDGFGHIVLVPDSPDSDQELLAICRANAA